MLTFTPMTSFIWLHVTEITEIMLPFTQEVIEIIWLPRSGKYWEYVTYTQEIMRKIVFFQSHKITYYLTVTQMKSVIILLSHSWSDCHCLTFTHVISDNWNIYARIWPLYIWNTWYNLTFTHKIIASFVFITQTIHLTVTYLK